MVTRINGFSGMDVDSMVKSMMVAKRIPLDKLNQEKQVLEWKRDSYREINSKLVDFRTNKLIDKYGKSAALNTQKAVVSGNADALKAEASATANGIDMKVSVTQVATKKTVETNGLAEPVASTKTLADLEAIRTGKDPAALTEGERKSLNEQEFKININNKDFVFTGSTSISTMVATINGNTQANVTAKYDEISGKLIINSKTSGTAGKVDINSGAGNDNTILNLFNPAGSTGLLNAKEAGQDAILFVNGKKFESASNTMTINGVQLTIEKMTVVPVDPLTFDPRVNPTTGDTPVSITTSSDTETAMQTIKSFVEDYNSLITLLNTKLGENKYRDFKPLTDEQKTAMKDTDITNWTDKAKSGLLKNDDILRSALSNMRGIISGQVVALSEMGITMGSYNSGGKIVLDEVVLKKALTENPQKAVDLFQGTGSEANNGIFDKLADKISGSLDSLVTRVGTSKFSADLTVSYKEESAMGRKLKEYNTRITNMLTILENTETRFYKQFTAMETAMNKLSSQSASLFSTTS